MLFSVSLKWYLSRILNAINTAGNPLHVFFFLVDHFEPGTGGVGKEAETQRLIDLKRKYPKIVSPHRDYWGNIPKRTWFFPPHYHRNYNLRNLVSLCEAG